MRPWGMSCWDLSPIRPMKRPFDNAGWSAFPEARSGVMGISSPVGLDESDTGLRKRKRRPAARSRADSALRVVQSLLLTTGAALLLVYAAAQIDAVRSRAHALEAFAVARSEHAAAVNARARAGHRDTSIRSARVFDRAQSSPVERAAHRRLPREHDARARRPARRAHDSPPSSSRRRSSRGTGELTLNRGIGRIEGTADVGHVR